MALRLVARPAGEARPALRAVGADGAAGADEVLDHRAGPVGEVVGAILERDRDAVRAPWPAAMEAPAEELECAEVDVIVQEAAHPGGRARALEGLAGDVHLHLGELGAARRRDEAPARRAAGDLGEPSAGADAEPLAGGHAGEPQLSGDVLAPASRRRGPGVEVEPTRFKGAVEGMRPSGP